MIIDPNKILTFGELIEKHAFNNQLTYGRKLTKRTVPKSLGGYSHPVIRDHISDQTRPRFILEMENSTIHFNGAIVLNNQNEIVKGALFEHQHGDDSPWLWRQRYLNIDISYPKQIVIGNSLYLTTIWWNNYYHFHVDVLGKLFIAAMYHSLEEFDHIIFPGSPSQYMLEIFSNLRLIDKLRLEPNMPIMYSKITIPSYSAFGDGYVPFDLINFLKKNVGGNIPVKTKSKIYISRKNATTRRVLNEDALEIILNKNGFKTLYLEHMPISEQISEFANASVIITPHGAGLTNLVYAQERTRILEFFSTHYVNKCFAELAGEANLDYHYAVFEKVPQSPEDIMVDLNILNDFL